MSIICDLWPPASGSIPKWKFDNKLFMWGHILRHLDRLDFKKKHILTDLDTFLPCIEDTFWHILDYFDTYCHIWTQFDTYCHILTHFDNCFTHITTLEWKVKKFQGQTDRQTYHILRPPPSGRGLKKYLKVTCWCTLGGLSQDRWWFTHNSIVINVFWQR